MKRFPLVSALLAALVAPAAFAEPVIVTDGAGNTFRLNEDGTYGVVVRDTSGRAYSLSPDGRWTALDADEVPPLAEAPVAAPPADGPATAEAPPRDAAEPDAAGPETAEAPPADGTEPETAEAPPPADAGSALAENEAITGKLAAFLKRETGIDDDAEIGAVTECVMQDVDALTPADRRRLAAAQDFEEGFYRGVAGDRPEVARRMEERIEECLNS